MTKWLFFRGRWDDDVLNPQKNNADMWMNLFHEICKDKNSMCDIAFYGKEIKHPITVNLGENEGHPPLIHSKKNISKLHCFPNLNYIFVRGGFVEYLPLLKNCNKYYPNIYLIRYGAGKRYMPEPNIKYNLILVDSEYQQKEVLSKYPKANVKLFIKPAARHFMPIPCEKEYDVCFIAKDPQAHFKGVQWVYDTVPRDINVLHLGSDGRHNPPSNVTCKLVDRIDMPTWISKCKIGIVPYFNKIDSCPRIIPEMTACGLPLVVSDIVNLWFEKYRVTRSNDMEFWEKVKLVNGKIYDTESLVDGTWSLFINNYYQKNLSVPVAAEHLRKLMGIE